MYARMQDGWMVRFLARKEGRKEGRNEGRKEGRKEGRGRIDEQMHGWMDT